MTFTRINNANSSVKEMSFPPPKVAGHELHKNGKLYPDAIIAQLKSLMIRDQKLSKNDPIFKKYPELSALKYSVASVTGPDGAKHLLAIYTGEKENKLIGKGSFGNVKYAQDLETGEWYAAKVIQKRQHIKVIDSGSQRADSFGSVVMNSVNEEYFQEFMANLKDQDEKTKTVEPMEFEILTEVGQAAGRFEQPNSPSKKVPQGWVIMKLANGKTLADYLEDNPALTVKQGLNIIQNMFHAFKELHDKDIIHRDIKTANMIFDPKTQQITLIDFGLSQKLYGKDFVTSIAVGTPGWVDPEIDELLDHIGKSPDELKEMWTEKWKMWAKESTQICEQQQDPLLEKKIQAFIKEGESIYQTVLVAKKLSPDQTKNLEMQKEAWQALGKELLNAQLTNVNPEAVKEWKNQIEVLLNRMTWSDAKKNGLVNFSKSTDIYSVGVAIKEILINVNREELKQYPDLVLMLDKCLDKDASKRPNIDQLIEMQKEISKSMEKDAPKKIGVVESQDLKISLLNSRMLQKLKIYDEIILVMNKDTSFKELVELKSNLERKGFVVSDRVIAANNAPVKEVIDQLRAANSSPSIIYAPAYGIKLSAASIQQTAQVQKATLQEKREKIETTLTSTIGILQSLQAQRTEGQNQYHIRQQKREALQQKIDIQQPIIDTVKSPVAAFTRADVSVNSNNNNNKNNDNNNNSNNNNSNIRLGR